MHICFGQQSYYYISHATCVSTWMHVWGCQGLDRGLVPMWIKSRWRPWQGRKTPVSHILVFYSAFTSTLPMAAWHVRLGFILECTVVCKTRKGTKPSALLSCSFFSWDYQLVMRGRWCWPASRWKDISNGPRINTPVGLRKHQMSTNLHLSSIKYIQITSPKNCSVICDLALLPWAQ